MSSLSSSPILRGTRRAAPNEEGVPPCCVVIGVRLVVLVPAPRMGGVRKLVVLRPAAEVVPGTEENAPAVVVAGTGTRRVVVGAGAVGRGDDAETEGAAREEALVPLMIRRCDRQECRVRTDGI